MASKDSCKYIYDNVKLSNWIEVKSVLEVLPLTKRKILVSSRYREGPLLLIVAQSNQIDLAKYLISECGADIEQHGLYGKWLCTPFQVAVMEKHYNMMELLLKLGANINAIDNLGQTVIMKTVIENDVKLVKYLHSKAASLTILDENGKNCLHYSIENTNMCTELLKLGASVNETDILGNSPLHYAIHCDCTSTIKLLVENGADLYMEDSNGCNALALALFKKESQTYNYLGHLNVYSALEITRSFRIAGANLADIEQEQDAFMYWMYANQCMEIGDYTNDYLKCMLETLFQPEDIHLYALKLKSNLLGVTHLETTLSAIKLSQTYTLKGEYRKGFQVIDDIIKFNMNTGDPLKNWAMVALIERIEISNIKFEQTQDSLSLSDEINTVLDTLSSQLNVYALKCVSINQDQLYNSRKYMAKYNCYFLDLIRLLLPFAEFDRELKYVICLFMKLSLKRTLNATILHLATKWNYPVNVIKILVECGADVNAKDAVGNTPLHLAVSKEINDINRSVVRLLVENGTDVQIENDFGEDTMERLTENKLFDRPRRLMTLQCLSAKVIAKSNLPITGECPLTVEKHIKLHSTGS